MTQTVVFCEQNFSLPQDTRVWREATALQQAGYRVWAICPRTSGGKFRETLQGVHIRRYPAPPELPGLFGQIIETLVALVCVTLITLAIRLRRRIDVLHAANPPDTFFLVARLFKPFGTRYVFDQHDLVPELAIARGSSSHSLQTRLFTALERGSYQAADMVITPNNSYRAIAVQRGKLQPQDVVTVRSGPDAVVSPNLSGGVPGPAHSVPVITFAGVMGRQDGVETLIDAIPHLLELTQQAFHVELIGRGTDVERLKARARQLRIGHLLTWVGWVNQETLRTHLHYATVAVSPDEDNPFTRRSTMTKIAEYLALGVPSVIAELPENRATAGNAALYYEAGSARDLAKCLHEVLQNKSLQNDLRARSLSRAKLLTWEYSASRLVTSYERLLGSVPIDELQQGNMLSGDQHINDTYIDLSNIEKKTRA